MGSAFHIRAICLAAAAGACVELLGVVAETQAVEAATVSVPCSTSTLQSDINGGSPGDVLDLAAGCTYTISSPYVSDDGLPLITVTNSPLTIVGNGATITASASGFRFFYVSGGTLTLQHLTLSNASLGNVGAAILDVGTAVVSDTTFSGNSITGFADGGAIATQGTLSVTASTFVDNHADNSIGGGAIAVDATPGTVTVSNSTFLDNTAVGSSGDGGALEVAFPATTTVNVVNSTFSGNSAHSSDTGTMYNGGSATTFTNTIVDATGATGGTCGGSTIPPVHDGGNNLEYNGGSPTTCGFSSNAVTAKPMLGTLQDNGGSTETMALLPGSPAIDAGSNTACAAAAPPPPSNTGAGGVDQRGVPRPQGSHCDIGAFEVDATSTTLSASPAAATVGGHITLTATVTPSSSHAGTPSGTVDFLDGATPIGSAAVNGANASITVTATTAGKHTFTATYVPSNGFFGSSGTGAATVSPPVPATGAGTAAAAALILAGALIAGLGVGRRRTAREVSGGS
jgi:predicted outer membrane repeat protein